MLKKIVLAFGAAGMLAAAGLAFAQTASVSGSADVSVSAPAQPMIIQVGPQGRILLRGTVDSVSAGSLTVKSWGGDWTVNVSSGTQIAPTGAAITSFKQGDFVGVQGMVNQSGSWTIDATLVRDWTERHTLNQERRQNQQSVRSEMKAGTPRTIQGIVSALSGQSFTLTTADGTAYSVTLASSAKILLKNWLTLDFAKVQNGDTVRVWGPVTNSNISAEIFRDLTVSL